MTDNSPVLAAATKWLPGWRAFFPPAQWLPQYRAAWLRQDAIAGITLAAYAIPVALAYASLAGLPPEYGIYCYLIAGPAYALFGSSRQLAIGPTSAISMLVGTTLLGMSEGDPGRWAQIAALTALLFAAMSIVAWLLRLSFLVNFISETILLGFKAGAALTIGLTQLPTLFGVSGSRGGFFERAWALGTQLPDTNFAVLAFGVTTIVLLVVGEKRLPGRPVALAVVAAATLVLTVTPLAQFGIQTVGVLPAGLPEFSPPGIHARDVDGVYPLAFACFLLAYIEGISSARALAQQRGYTIDARQELFALGVANAAVAFGHGYPVAGGLSQSTVNDRAGAKTPLALLFASAAMGLCLMFLTGLLTNLPTVVLAAIVLVAIMGLVDIPELARVWRLSRTEFWIAMTAFAGVLVLGILQGVLFAVIVSVLLLIQRTALPHVARLGRVPGTRRYSDCERNPDNEDVPGVLIVRVESALLYFNVAHIRERVRELIAAAGPDLRLVVWDLSTSATVDIAGARLLRDLTDELAARGVLLRLVEARAGVRDIVRAEVGTGVGEISRRIAIDDVITSAIAGEAGWPHANP